MTERTRQDRVAGSVRPIGRLLTPKEAADTLRMEVQWIYDNRKRLEIPFLKLGHVLRIRESDLAEWLERQHQ